MWRTHRYTPNDLFGNELLKYLARYWDPSTFKEIAHNTAYARAHDHRSNGGQAYEDFCRCSYLIAFFSLGKVTGYLSSGIFLRALTIGNVNGRLISATVSCTAH